MLRKWLEKYRSQLGESRFLSRAGAFVMVVLAISEAATVIYAIAQAEDPGSEVVVAASIPVVVYFLVFGIRLCLLYKIPNATAVHLVTWWVAAVGVYACADSNPHFYYFRLEHAGVFFIFFSSIAFLVAAALAMSDRNDLNSNS